MKKIREATLQDADAIAEISTESLGYPCRPCLAERRLKALDTVKQKIFVALENQIVVGFAQAELYQLLYQEDKINILGLAVRKDKQGQGFGTELVKAVERWAEEMNCVEVRVNSAFSRTEAHRFYEKLGYKNTKSQKRFMKQLQQ